MAVTDAINTAGALVFPYDELIVLLGDTDGTVPIKGDPGDPEADPPVDPIPADTFEDVYCFRVVQSAGGSRLDFAHLKYNLDDHLINRSQPGGFSRMVDVRLPDTDETLIHRGDYVRESAEVSQENEELLAQSQLRAYHFGGPLEEYDVHSPTNSAAFIEDDVVFNPVVDDRVVFNRSSRVRFALDGFLWAHPEMADTTVGETFQEQTRNEWTLRQAVLSAIELLNPNEEFINNPSTTALDVLDDAPPIRNVVIPLGTYLPQALDILLIPHGYNWFVDYEAVTDADPAPLPLLTVFKIGAGTEKELNFQAPGATLALASSNVNQFSTDNAIGDSFNEVRAYGEREEAECTFPLYAAWPSADDTISPEDLAKDGSAYSTHRTAWRLFIGNEAGDIDPTAARLGQTPVVPDMEDWFDKAPPHRRVLGEPLTYLVDAGAAVGERQRMPHVIEWSDDSGSTWQAAPDEWTIKLCPDQIGILFDGKDIPQELYDAGSAGRLRITGTVFADSRITYLATRQAESANGRDVLQVITRPEKFQKRFRNSSGSYASVLSGEADTRDDSTEIQDYAEKLRDRNHFAEIDCEFRLPGWHLYYKIGDLLTKIAGREISLNAAPAVADPTTRYVQIVERRFEMSPSGGPSTVLIVDRGVAQA